MSTTPQLSLSARCPRCGRVLHDDWELGELCGAARASLERMKLAIPPGVKVALELVRDEMICRIGKCEARG
jgi:hypothetical protein